jgi:hypothetical protein
MRLIAAAFGSLFMLLIAFDAGNLSVRSGN